MSPKLLLKKLRCSKCGSVLEFDQRTGELILEPVKEELIDLRASYRAFHWLILRDLIFCNIVMALAFWLCL